MPNSRLEFDCFLFNIIFLIVGISDINVISCYSLC